MMNELREEVGELVSSALGGREGEVDGGVAEALGNIDSEAGMRKMKEVLAKPERVTPWFKNGWILALSAVAFLIGGWFVKSVTYDPNVTSVSLPTSNSFGLRFLTGLNLKGDPYELSEKEKWLLSGDTFHPIKESSPYPSEQSDAAQKQHAAEYAYQYERVHHVFPDDLLEIGASVDADNPWYLYMKVCDLAKVTVSEKSKKERERKDEYKQRRERRIAKAGGVDEPAFVVDEHYRSRLSEAWDLLEKADGMENLKQHRLDLAEKRLCVLANEREHDYLSRIAFVATSAGFSSDGIHYLRITEVFNAKFEELGEGGDKVKLQQWLGIYRRFMQRILDDRCTMIDLLVLKSYLKNYTTIVLKAAEQAGLDEEVEKIKALGEQLADDKLNIVAMMGQRTRQEDGSYGLLSGLLGSNQVSLKPLEFDPMDHVPDRYADHSMMTKYLATTASALIFLLLLCVASYLFYKGKLAWFFGERVLGVLTFKDWVLIILGGVILPILLYYVVNQHTSLGVRKWNIMALKGLAVVVQFVSMLVLSITTGYCLLRWRLAVRSDGLVTKVDRWAWCSLVSSLLAMLLIGASGYGGSWVTYIAYACLAFPILFLLVRGMKGLVSSERLIAISAINRGMIILLILTTICTALLAPFYYADEKKWIREDTLITLNPKYLGEDTRSYRIMQAMKEELNERLEMIR